MSLALCPLQLWPKTSPDIAGCPLGGAESPPVENRWVTSFRDLEGKINLDAQISLYNTPHFSSIPSFDPHASLRNGFCFTPILVRKLELRSCLRMPFSSHFFSPSPRNNSTISHGISSFLQNVISYRAKCILYCKLCNAVEVIRLSIAHRDFIDL